VFASCLWSEPIVSKRSEISPDFRNRSLERAESANAKRCPLVQSGQSGSLAAAREQVAASPQQQQSARDQRGLPLFRVRCLQVNGPEKRRACCDVLSSQAATRAGCRSRRTAVMSRRLVGSVGAPQSGERAPATSALLIPPIRRQSLAARQQALLGADYRSVDEVGLADRRDQSALGPRGAVPPGVKPRATITKSALRRRMPATNRHAD
jgi:hypothetical protein